MFDPIKEMQSMDIRWLRNNGWTAGGNLAYRHILYEFNNYGVPSAERIEEILIQYEALDQRDKITQELRDLIQLKRDLNQ